jgi:polyphosphate glucokinase
VEILGIDIGGSGIKGAPVDINTGQLTVERHRIATPKHSTPEAVAEVVAELVNHFGWRGPVGCAFPARIKQGVAQTASNIDKAWVGTDAATLFEGHTGCPFFVLNDADAAGVAEMTFGVGRDRQDVVLLLTFGTGIGSALFIQQTLLPNTEFGHLFMHGKIAEAYAADSVRKRERLSWKAWAKRVQEYLDRIEFLFAPDLLILGGGISKPKRRDLYLPYLKTKAELVTAALRNEAGIVGAAFSAHHLARLT